MNLVLVDYKTFGLIKELNKLNFMEFFFLSFFPKKVWFVLKVFIGLQKLLDKLTMALWGKKCFALIYLPYNNKL